MAHLISRFGHTRLAGAVGATIERVGFLYAMPDDSTPAMFVDGCGPVNRALGAVERVRDERRDDFN